MAESTCSVSTSSATWNSTVAQPNSSVSGVEEPLDHRAGRRRLGEFHLNGCRVRMAGLRGDSWNWLLAF
jgi:hypothetical protein